jgi:hypothetical protein
MKTVPFFSLLLASCVVAAQGSRPEFALDSAAASGVLSWLGHTVVFDLDAPVPADDHIQNDTKAGDYDIGLSWRTKPDVKTGEILTTNFFWRIPKSDLFGSHYVFSAERSSHDGIVFVLREKGRIIRKSQVCRLEKGFLRTLGDAAEHMPKLTTKDLVPGQKGTPNQSPEATPGKRPPASPSPSSGAPQL